MGRLLVIYLEGNRIYTCIKCQTHLTRHQDLLSKAFTGRTGRAFLFNQVVNVNDGEPDEQMLMTGRHTICDISCKNCNAYLGWKYIKAYEAEQKYKEGKFILEKANLQREKWDEQ